MPKEFTIIEKFLGYFTKKDKTHIGPGFLVDGSQNVLINDAEKVEIRGGYSVFGAESSDENDIESAYDWETSSEDILSLRSKDDTLQFYDTNSTAWVDLKDSFSAIDFIFTTWWDTTEGIDLLLFVNGSDKIWDWSGGVAVLDSVTANTIKKTGTATWGESRFLTAGTRKVVIDGTEYTYTGGESTTTLTGVTPSPAGETPGETVFQAIRENDNQPANGVTNDIISVLNNQVWVGSNKSKEVYVSANDDFTDYTFSSPRIPGEGALMTIDSVARAFGRRADEMWVFAGRNDFYKSSFEQLEINSVLSETLNVKKIKTGVEQGAQSQDLVCEMGDYIAFLTFEPALRIIGSAEDLENPIMENLSDSIKPDIEGADFTGGHLKFHRNRLYLSAPADGKVFINETRQTDEGVMRFWQPPQILPISKFAIIDGNIHGHSYLVTETYKLFDGTNDNGNSFEAKMALSYMDFGDRINYKVFDEFVSEGYISSNTKLKLDLNYNYGGSLQKVEKEIDGADDNILFENVVGGILGDDPLGDEALGGSDEDAGNPKFRVIHDIPLKDFHQIQAVFSTDTTDAYWEVLCFGANIRLSSNQPISIKK